MTFTVHLVRHAPTSSNFGRRFMGQLDVPPIRVEDPARYAVARSRPRQVYSSPLTRARASAGILFPGESAHIDPQLMDRSGRSAWTWLR